MAKGKLTKGEDDVAKGDVLSPLYELGNKGGNPEAPAPDDFENFSPRDPMGFLNGLGSGGREK